MRTGFYDPIDYVDSITAKDRLARIAWTFTWTLLFRTSPSPMRAFRRTLLRCFGATVSSSANVYPSARIHAPWKLTLGRRVCIGPKVELYNVAKITIEDDATVSQYSYLCTASHDIHSPGRELISKPIHVCRGVWVFAGAMIAPGVTLSEGAVVGARALVTRDVPPYAVYGGNPAREIGTRRYRPDALLQ